MTLRRMLAKFVLFVAPGLSFSLFILSQISMLWNWYTVDACFLSSQWHVRSAGAFAGSVIAVFIITALVEGVRRAAREYDRQIVIQAQQRLRATEAATRLTSDASSGKGTDSLKSVFFIVVTT